MSTPDTPTNPETVADPIASGSAASGDPAAASGSAADTPIQPPFGEQRKPRTWWQAPRCYVLVYTALFVCIEVVSATAGPQWAAPLHGILAFVTVNHALFGRRNARTSGMVLATLSTVRIVTIELPGTGTSIFTRTAMIGACSIVAWYFATWIIRQDVATGRTSEVLPTKAAFAAPGAVTVLVAAGSIFLGGVAYALLAPSRPHFLALGGNTFLPWMAALGSLLVGALAEELLYRRLVAAMVHHTGRSQTPWISAALFGSTYLGTHNAGFVVLAVATGALFAWSCEHTGNIRGPVIGHFLLSATCLLILPSMFG